MPSHTHTTRSASIRSGLDHPIVDSDGHVVEYIPALEEFFARAGVPFTLNLDRFVVLPRREGDLGPRPSSWVKQTPEARAAGRLIRPPWWGVPTVNTFDLATAVLPKLLYERLDDFGIDFAIMYPTVGLGAANIVDDALRVATCRTLNRFYAEIFDGLDDRIGRVAVVPMYTPDEAIAEMDYAVNELGFKSMLVPGFVTRPIQAPAPGTSSTRSPTWRDTFGLDSEYDYDPFWGRCVELGVPPTFHSGSLSFGSRQSITSYMYNHIGHHAAGNEAVCKSLLMGGVTRRFPSLRFAFLEGGVNWAVSLYADLIGHWEKRNAAAIAAYDPARVDAALFADLMRRYGGPTLVRADGEGAEPVAPSVDPDEQSCLDEFAACGIERPEDIRDRFVPSFYFGCEADDPTNANAFRSDANPYGARLRAIFSSDISHWDVPDMTAVVEEAWELVEHGLLSEADFREFTFTNACGLYLDMNPDFFAGTVVERHVDRTIWTSSH